MSDLVQLREYQQDAVIEILGAWQDDVQRPAVVLPTGSGKTVIFAALCRMLARRGDRPLILVNRDELVRQTVKKLHDADPTMVVGIVQGPSDDHRGHVVVASVQTLSRVARLNRVDMSRYNRIICDEAHYAAADSWRRVLEYFGAFDKSSGTKIVGFTATMTRTDKRGLGEIWEDVVYERSTRWAIKEGFLVPVTAQRVVLPDLHLENVKISKGDLQDGDLGRAMAQAGAGPLIAQAYLELAQEPSGGLRRGIVFTPTIETAQSFLDDFRAAGIPTELVIGSTPTTERQAKYAATRDGSNRVLMSVGVLTTGFDLPAVEVAVIARPTKSRGLYQQMIGRALRLSPETGKTSAMILDVVGASRLGLATLVDLALDKPEVGELVDTGELDALGVPIFAPFVEPVPEEIAFRQINPFDGMEAGEIAARKILLRRPAQSRFWQHTDGHVPFLPPSQNFTDYVCLRPSDAGWQVWQVPKGKGGSMMLGEYPNVPEAVVKAHEVRGQVVKLDGSASPAQIALLARLGISHEPNLSKHDAGDLITQRFASKRLDS